VARLGKTAKARIALMGKPEDNLHLEDLGIDGRMLLKWNLKKDYGLAWKGLTWLRIRTIGASCEQGNEHVEFCKMWRIY